MVQQSQEGKQPDAAMVLAEAEMAKGQAAQMREQNNQVAIAGDLEKKKADSAIDVFNAQTTRFQAETDAAYKGQKIQLDKASAIGKQYVDLAKSLRTSANGLR
jgi:hypothetical protein